MRRRRLGFRPALLSDRRLIVFQLKPGRRRAAGHGVQSEQGQKGVSRMGEIHK